ncbi:MAG: TRAP transporter substrate-binding protein [Desulfocapsaceae bacterium]|nr:TRAP transporter substrate-binding protein [Desulfocapsaceae bacterium]
MHSRITILLSILLCLLFLSSNGLASTTKLRVVGSWSSLTLYKNFENPFWTEVVPAEMGMETSMTSLSQVKLKGPAVVRQMSMGVFDVVHTVADYIVSDSPDLAGLDLPGVTTDIETAKKAVAAYRPALEKYLADDFDVKLLSVVPYPAQVLFSSVPISGLDDLKGKKIRASGWTTSEFVTALGATGVTMSFSEVPQALQRGVVDCAITGSLSGYSAGWGEVSDYIYPLPVGGWDYVIGVISMSTWNKLSAEQQTKLQTLITEKLEEPGWAVTAKETQEGIDCLTGKECPHGEPQNLTEVPVTDEARQQVKEVLVNNVLPALAEKVKPETITTWNDTIGKVVGVQAK